MWQTLREPLLIAALVLIVQWVVAPFVTGVVEGLLKIESVQYPAREIESRVRGEFHRERIVGAVLGLVAAAIYAFARP
ncbi:MAG: hypothetical protein ACT4PL_07250 [Phycisphaerales bacterium]